MITPPPPVATIENGCTVMAVGGLNRSGPQPKGVKGGSDEDSDDYDDDDFELEVHDDGQRIRVEGVELVFRELGEATRRLVYRQIEKYILALPNRKAAKLKKMLKTLSENECEAVEECGIEAYGLADDDADAEEGTEIGKWEIEAMYEALTKQVSAPEGQCID